MRILSAHVDPGSGHTYAAIVNPIAGGLAGQPAHRYRLICALTPDWVNRANTTRSISKTPGILIYETFDVPECWADTQHTQERIASLIEETRLLAGELYREQAQQRRQTP